MTDLVVITGASSGLGLALARSTPFPAVVVDISRSGPPGDEPIEHYRADLADPAHWAGVGSHLRSLLSRHGPARAVFIHAAGTLTPIGFAGEVETGAYTENVLLNSAAGQVLGHAFLEAVRDREGVFDLIQVTSGAARSVYPGWSSYGAGKAAIDQWVRIAGAEQKSRGGVRVAAIAPGVMATAMQSEIRETEERDFPRVERFHDLLHEGRLVEPEEAARRIWEAIEEGLEPGAVIDIRHSG
ncbi:MAG TPA: SDR family NAD(P)-dependent oxidoreductase [Acidimicrobiia bacterium]|nr:SDR family NAD(P)-dependent oxidoreductase [Acidimicrobiia bacterium]